MPAKCGARVCTFLRRQKAPLCLLGASAAALGAFYALRGNRALMNLWVSRVSMPVKGALGALVNPLPFSFCELAATAAGAAVLAALARAVFLAVKRRENRLPGLLLWVAAAVLAVYVAVCALWGTQYYADSFADQAGMATGAVSTEDLRAVTAYFAQQTNAAAGAVPRDADGCFSVPNAEILQKSAGCYDGILSEYPFLAGPARSPKPAFYSKLMSAVGFTGYLCPLFGETTLNVDAPAVFLPVTIAHEISHQRGVAAEQEANYCGIEACLTGTDAAYRYSGWLFGYLHLANALYAADYAGWVEISQTLCAGAHADLAANNAYWAAWEGPAKTAGDKVYTSFLQGYGQSLGLHSYGACVDLLVERYSAAAHAG